MSKILYFGSFEKPYDTELYVSNTLEEMGHTVDKHLPHKTTISKLEELLKQDYDFVLLSKGWFPDEEKAIELLKETKIKTIGWFWDLCWGTPREWLLTDHHLFKADIVFTSDGGDNDWGKYGINHEVLRQGIYEPESNVGEFKKQYAYDVVFVGSNVHKSEFGWEHRGELLAFLKTYYGDRFKHFGNDDGIRNQTLNDLYASAKVVVGDSVSSPNYWSNRLYETTGRGGFLIFPLVEGLDKEFTPYKHFIPYNYYDFSALAEKIDYFISHDKERDEIRKAGHEYCIKNHTYKIRCEQLLTYIKNNG